MDINSEDMAAAVTRLVGLGASVVAENSSPHHTWTAMQDPEGNEFG